jgi:hypothetical protein
MQNYIISDLLRKYRYDGKRFWFKHNDGIWRWVSASSMTLFLRCHLKIPKNEAIRVRGCSKMASKDVNDPAWAEKVRWLEFTRRGQLMLVGDRVDFYDPHTGRITRRMKVFDFNEKLRKDFPNKGQVREGGIAFLFL